MGGKVIEVNTYELNMNSGVRYRIECGSEEIDQLIELIGEENILDCEEI